MTDRLSILPARWAWLLVALALLGCTLPLLGPVSLPNAIDQSYLTVEQAETVGELSGGATVRQSFMPARDGLHRVTVRVATFARDNEGHITFELRDDAGQLVHQETVDVDVLQDNALYHLRFWPQPDSALRRYTLEARGDSPPGEGVTLWADTTDRYPGLLQRDGEARAGDLVLEWAVQPTLGGFAFHLARDVRRWGGTMGLTALLWLLPGLAALLWLRPRDATPWSAPMAGGAALALSGAALVLLPQATALVGVRLGPWTVWALLAGSAGALGLALARGRRLRLERPGGVAWLYAALLGLVIASRWVAMTGLAGPQWGDSVHHALITGLLLDHGGLFDDYAPLLPLAPFTYHAGFHLLAAWLGWSVLPGQPVLYGATATLLAGQWLNVVAVVMVALLAEGLARWGGWRGARVAWVGVLALALAGLWSPMPAFYINWGRYTQLAGQIFLPPALLWSLRAWEPGARRRALVPLVLVVAALALTHYRVLPMYAVAVPWLWLAAWWRGQRGAWRAALGRAVASGLAVALLVLPWYATLVRGAIASRAARLATAAARPSGFNAAYNAVGDLYAYVPRGWLVAAALAFLWLLLRRRAAGALLGAWSLSLLLLSNPYALRLPGTGLVNNFTVQIALYLPLGAALALAGVDGAAWLAERIRLPRRALATGAALALLVGGVWGAWERGAVADARRFSMLTAADEQAAAWVAANTPADALFHVNGFMAYNDSTVAGTDGGWWLWLTAGRATTVPPMVYAHESSPEPGYRQRVNERFRRLLAAQDDPGTLADAMREEGIDYLYVGAQDGWVGLPAGVVPLDPLTLRASPAFETVYSDDLVWVFRLKR